MKIASLYAENFMLYPKFKKSFVDKTVIGIVAEYKSNRKRSNKGAKSTILEMVYYALTGDSRAKRDVELIHYGKDVMRVVLTLIEDDGTKIEITRGRDIKGNGILNVNGIERKGDAQELINEIIGYDKKELLLTCFLRQMEIEGFMSLGPAAMKQHLMSWLENTHWTKLEMLVTDDLKVKQKELERNDAKLEILVSQKKEHGKIKNVKKELLVSQEKLEIIHKKVLKLERQSAESKQKRKSLDHDSLKIQEQIDEVDVLIEELEYCVASNKAEAELLEKYKKYKNFDIEGAIKERANLHATVRQAEDLLEKMEDDFTGVCPVLNEPCDRVKTSKSQVKGQKAIIDDLQTRLDKITASMLKQSKWEDADEASKLIKAARTKLKPLKSKAEKLNSELAALVKVDNQTPCKSDLRADLNKARERHNTLSQLVGQLKATVVTIKKTRLQIKDLKLSKGVLLQDIADLRYVSNMFGKNGIPSLEIENAFDEVEDEINFVLDRLKIGLQVEFRPTREINTWEDYCVSCGWQFPKGTRNKVCGECGVDRRKKRKDELHLSVVEGDEESGFHMESGGGKTLVSLAVRLGFTRLKQRQISSPFRVLFLDEPDASLDPVNKSAFIKLITETLIDVFGFEQIFWVSHDRNIQESIPDILKVTKYGTYSKASWL